MKSTLEETLTYFIRWVFLLMAAVLLIEFMVWGFNNVPTRVVILHGVVAVSWVLHGMALYIIIYRRVRAERKAEKALAAEEGCLACDRPE